MHSNPFAAPVAALLPVGILAVPGGRRPGFVKGFFGAGTGC